MATIVAGPTMESDTDRLHRQTKAMQADAGISGTTSDATETATAHSQHLYLTRSSTGARGTNKIIRSGLPVSTDTLMEMNKRRQIERWYKTVPRGPVKTIFKEPCKMLAYLALV